jgi:ABC-type glucose/galactose transport system permease subunit
VDWRILPFLGLVFALALIDRTNLGVARIVGMGHDLARLLLSSMRNIAN